MKEQIDHSYYNSMAWRVVREILTLELEIGRLNQYSRSGRFDQELKEKEALLTRKREVLANLEMVLQNSK